MVLPLLAILVGFTALICSADRFILGASTIARYCGVSALLIGLTIVALGTSLPELLVSFSAALSGKPALALGNALGSNIANTGLVVGVTAMIVPLKVRSALLKREFPLMFCIMTLVLFVLLDFHLSFVDGALLILGLCLLMGWLIKTGLRESKNRKEPLNQEFETELQKPSLTLRAAVIWLIFGLIVLPLSAELTVWGAIDLARKLGISELTIGLTVVALGTSLPELAASVMSALKNEPDIALGNVIGSNMFNLLGVIGLPTVIQQFEVPRLVLTRDFMSLFVITFILYITAYGRKKSARINRAEGLLLTSLYALYLFMLYETAS